MMNNYCTTTMKQDGWFVVGRPIGDERGRIQDATTNLRLIAGQHNEHGKLDRPRASLVLARPEMRQWHQIQRHLNGSSHPISGDTIHGISKENRVWKEKFGLQSQRMDCNPSAFASIWPGWNYRPFLIIVYRFSTCSKLTCCWFSRRPGPLWKRVSCCSPFQELPYHIEL